MQTGYTVRSLTDLRTNPSADYQIRLRDPLRFFYAMNRMSGEMEQMQMLYLMMCTMPESVEVPYDQDSQVIYCHEDGDVWMLLRTCDILSEDGVIFSPDNLRGVIFNWEGGRVGPLVRDGLALSHLTFSLNVLIRADAVYAGELYKN